MSEPQEFLTCACDHCGQSLEFPAEMSDHQSACPTCGYQVLLKPGDRQRAQPPTPELTRPATPSLPGIEKSGVADALSVIAVLELIAAPIAGLIVGQDNTFFGWMIVLSGLMSGLILLGFARVIEHLFESAQRLRRIEILLQKASDEKVLHPSRL
jgi:DNA-directed RNA polymerase subunit RPC12/RpoP